MLYTLQLGALAANCYILANEDKKALIIDAGGSYSKLKKFLYENEIKPEAVLLTHGHFDHIGAVSHLKADFPEIRIFINKDDEMIYEGYVSCEELPHYLSRDDYKDFAPTDDIKGKTELHIAGFDIKIIPCPGHTPGGVSYMTGKYLFTGDTLFRGSMGRIDLLGGSKDDMIKSLATLYNLEGDYIVLPGHESASTLEEERKTNPYMKLAVK